MTQLESVLSALWAATLRRASVGLHDDFFLAGGDSLRAARLLDHVRAAFGVDLPLEALFDEASTVAGMARQIERARLQAPRP